jgi:hypothetical protein
MTTNRLAFGLEPQPPVPERPQGPSGDRSLPHGSSRSLTPDPAIGLLIIILAVASVPESLAPSWRGDLITVASGGLALVVAARAALPRFRLVLPLQHFAPSLVLTAAVLLWALLQASPLPDMIRGGALNHPLWRLAADALPAAPAGAISLDPSAGVTALLILLRSLAVIWATFQLATTSRNARQLLLTVTILGAIAVAASLILRAVAPQAAGGGASPAVAGLCLLAVVTLRIGHAPGRPRPGPAAEPPLVARLRQILAARWWAPLAVLFFVAGLVIAAGLTGLIATLVGMLAFLLAIASAPSLARLRPRLGFAASLAFVLGALFVELFAASGRINAAPASDSAETALPAVAAQAIADAPWLGTGYGTFGPVARLYGAAAADPQGAGPGFYLRTLVELGVPAGLALILAAAGLFVLCAEGVRLRRRNAIFPCLGVGAIALMASDAVTGTGAHGPLPALIWCVIMGAACAQSLPTSERHGEAQIAH